MIVSHLKYLRPLAAGPYRLSAVLRSFVVSLLAFAILLPLARAQTAHYTGVQTLVYTPANGSLPARLAVDTSGSLYVCDTVNNQVLKFAPSGSGFLAPTVVVSGLKGPSGIAVASNGTVFISDTGNARVLREVPSGGTYVQTVVDSSMGGPQGVAVDNSGNVFIADPNNKRVIRDTPVGAAYSATYITSGLSDPQGVVVSGTSVYVADEQKTAVLKYTLQSGTTYVSAASIGSGFLGPYDLAIDSGGNVFVADIDGTITKETVSGSTYKQTAFARPNASAVAVDATGNVFFVDSGQAQVDKIAPGFPAFGSTYTNGGISAPQLAIFVVDTGGSLEPKVSTQGVTGLDFQFAPNTQTQSFYTYNAKDQIPVSITFTPSIAGVRYGAAQILNSTGAPVASLYLQGNGLGPQAAIYPGQESVLFSSSALHPQAIAIDPIGNIYLCDPANNQVIKKTLTRAGYSSSTIGAGLSGPSGLALDGAGSVYISDPGNSRTLKETPNGSGGYNQSTVAFATTPAGLAISGAGVLYVADSGNGLYTETANPAGGYLKGSMIGSVASPNGVAIDDSGDLYVSDPNNKQIVKETPNGSGGYTESTVMSGFTPSGVSVDGAGNVYVPDSDNGRIVVAMPSGGSYSVFTAATGLATPGAVVVDGQGNLYIADTGNQRVLKEDVQDGQNLQFPATSIGAKSASQMIRLADVGTSPLTLSVPSSGYNPTVPANFTLDNASTCTQVSSTSGTFSVYPNANCFFAVDFAPTSSASYNGFLTMTDNSGNAAGSEQSVYVSGTGVLGSKTITFPQPATPAALGSSATLTATASNGDSIVYAVTSGTASLSGSTINFNAAGAVTITASSPASANYASATPVSVTVQVVAQQTVSWTPSTLSIYTGTALGTGVLDATSSVPATIAYTSQLQPSGSTSTATPSTLLPMGHYLLTATVTPSSAGYSSFASSLPFYVQNMNPFISNSNGTVSSVYNNGNAQSSSTSGGGIGAAVDSTGFVWSLTPNGSAAVKYTDTGVVAATYNSVGLSAATALAVDGLGQVWIANGNNTLTVLSNTGSIVSTTATSSFNGATGIAIDMSGNVWVASSANNTVEEVIGGAAPVAPLTNAVQNLSPATRP